MFAAINGVLLSVSLTHIVGMFDLQQYAIHQSMVLENTVSRPNYTKKYSSGSAPTTNDY